jgi:hypothetical protein
MGRLQPRRSKDNNNRREEKMTDDDQALAAHTRKGKSKKQPSSPKRF